MSGSDSNGSVHDDARLSSSRTTMPSSSASSSSVTLNITVRRAIEFNNAGVQVAAAGHPRVAWELFKGALEVKLAVERYVASTAAAVAAAPTTVGREQEQQQSFQDLSHSSMSSNMDASTPHGCRQHEHCGTASLQVQQQEQELQHYEQHGEGPPPPPYPSNVFIEQAERHMGRIETYICNPMPWHHRNSLLPPTVIPSPTVSLASTAGAAASINGTSASAVTVTPDSSPSVPSLKAPVENAVRPHYTPRLLTRPLLLDSPSDDPLVRAVRSGRESATIIYNLALSDHLNYTASDQAIALYDLALSLVRTPPVIIGDGGGGFDLLCISLFNNVGVWSYESGDIDSAQACMHQLLSILHQDFMLLGAAAPPVRICRDDEQGDEMMMQVSVEENDDDPFVDDEEGRAVSAATDAADADSATIHTQHDDLLRNTITYIPLEPNEQQSLESNIRWFMDPFYEASPAA